MVDVGVRGDQVLAVRQREIHLPNQFDDVVERVLITDVHQQPFAGVVDEVHAAAEPSPGLLIHFNDAGEHLTSSLHCRVGS